MGLDQWIYKVRKTKKGVISDIDGKLYREVSEKYPNLLIFDDGDDGHLLDDLRPYMDSVTLVTFSTDFDAIKRDNGIPDDAHLVGAYYSQYGDNEYIFATDVEYKNVYVSADNADKYEVPRKYPYLVGEGSDILYWRKFYKLQEALYDILPIENCGFYFLDDDALDLIMDIDPDVTIPRTRKGEGLFYHEWY